MDSYLKENEVLLKKFNHIVGVQNSSSFKFDTENYSQKGNEYYTDNLMCKIISKTENFDRDKNLNINDTN